MVIILVLVVLSATAVFSASMTGSTKRIGGGSTSVGHTGGAVCRVDKSETKTAPTLISTKLDGVYCDTTGTYTFKATTSSGASSVENQVELAVIVDVKAKVEIIVSPSVSTTGNGEFSTSWTATLP